MLRVGLTGGLASGKSTVGRWLEDLGCSVSDSDRLVAELYRPGAAGTEAVRRLFGDEVLDEQGGVDKAELAERVFGHPVELRRLERAIHPLVGEAYRRWVKETEGILVFEVPLMAETGGGDRYDYVVTVEARPELRLQRAIDRGVDEDSARARLEAQASSDQRIALADRVLRNDGSLEELREQVEALVEELRKREGKDKGVRE